MSQFVKIVYPKSELKTVCCVIFLGLIKIKYVFMIDFKSYGTAFYPYIKFGKGEDVFRG